MRADLHRANFLISVDVASSLWALRHADQSCSLQTTCTGTKYSLFRQGKEKFGDTWGQSRNYLWPVVNFFLQASGELIFQNRWWTGKTLDTNPLCHWLLVWGSGDTDEAGNVAGPLIKHRRIHCRVPHILPRPRGPGLNPLGGEALCQRKASHIIVCEFFSWFLI